MRIALITREYPPETAWGGIGTFYGTFARVLREAGHDVEVFTQGVRSGGSAPQDGVMVHRVMPRQWVIGARAGGDLAGMKAQHLGVFSLSLAVSMLQAFASRHRAAPFDLVEGHEHLGINSLINLRFGGSCKTISRYHTAYHSLVSRKLANWPDSGLIRRLEALSLRSAHARISASAYIEEMTRRDFPKTPACDAIIPLFPANGGATAPQTDVEAREKLMVFVGRLMPGHKNPEMAAQAFCAVADQFSDWRIEFAGLDIEVTPGDSVWRRCERILGRFTGRFEYHGVLNPEEVRKLYGRARIALMPSGFESFGLVALESMAAGCVPVIADGTALPEIVGEAGVLFRNGSLPELAAKLAALMHDPMRQQALSRIAVDRVRERFSFDRILAQNLDFFARLVRARRAL